MKVAVIVFEETSSKQTEDILKLIGNYLLDIRVEERDIKPVKTTVFDM